MKANELRIRNLILVDGLVAHLLNVDDEECDIQYEDKINGMSYMNNERRWFKDFDPIPLTEEWLIKLGFKTEFYGGQGNVGTTATTDTGINKHYPILFEIYNYAGTDYWLFENGLKWRLEIKHVHQLQNVYFALTGEELEIK